MPEGPECRRMAHQLAERVSNRTIKSIEIVSGRYTKKPIENIEKFEDDLPIKIQGAGVHGKFIFFLLNSQWSIWNTLGMTGSWSSDTIMASETLVHLSLFKVNNRLLKS